ncbi:hypothetical protein Tco_0616599 [Tanacetum coccineum]
MMGRLNTPYPDPSIHRIRRWKLWIGFSNSRDKARANSEATIEGESRLKEAHALERPKSYSICSQLDTQGEKATTSKRTCRRSRYADIVLMTDSSNHRIELIVAMTSECCVTSFPSPRSRKLRDLKGGRKLVNYVECKDMAAKSSFS